MSRRFRTNYRSIHPQGGATTESMMMERHSTTLRTFTSAESLGCIALIQPPKHKICRLKNHGHIFCVSKTARKIMFLFQTFLLIFPPRHPMPREFLVGLEWHAVVLLGTIIVDTYMVISVKVTLCFMRNVWKNQSSCLILRLRSKCMQ